jgi:hypothetical protein
MRGGETRVTLQNLRESSASESAWIEAPRVTPQGISFACLALR